MSEISIIVPCYNVEKYLHRSMRSLIEQTFDDIEIICINDGSTDKTLKILNGYASDDKRIKIIDQKNKGVGAARNAGLKIATGKYLMFLDPDDYFEPFACEKAYESIERDKTDIVIFGYYDLYNGKKIDSYRAKQIHRSSSGLSKFDYPLHFFIFQKIYSKAFLDKHNIIVPENLSTAEDIIFHYLFVFNNANFSQIDENLVVYQKNRIGSITTKTVNSIKTDLDAAKTICSSELYKKQPLALRKRLAEQWIDGTAWNYEKYSDPKIRFSLRKDINKMIKYLESLFDKDELDNIYNYTKLKKILHDMPFNYLKYLIFPKKDRVYSEDFEVYLEEINFKKTIEKIKKKVKDKKVVLYGAGSLLQSALKEYDFSGFNIVGISDRSFGEEKEGEFYLEYKIIPLSKLHDYEYDVLLVSAKKYENIILCFKKDKKYKKIRILPLFKV